jgi:hypothetical protein
MKKYLFTGLFFFMTLGLGAQNKVSSAANGTSGKLTVNFSTTMIGTTSKIVFAIYITDNTTGKLTNTLFYRTKDGQTDTGTVNQDLPTWFGLIGSTWPTTKTLILTDANTGATISGSLTNQVAYWGNNSAAATAVSAVPDGTYKVNFEMAGYSPLRPVSYSTTFVKGPTPSGSIPVTASTGFSGITISWVPVNTAVQDVELGKLYNVYPNPAISNIYVSGSDVKEVEICSLAGKSILVSKVQNINVSSLPKGVYLAVIRAANGTVVKKIEKR